MVDIYNTYVKQFALSQSDINFLDDFYILYEETRKIFKKVILISSLTNSKNHCNIAIDTSNSTDTTSNICNKYNILLFNFVKKYTSPEVYKTIITFKTISPLTLNLSCNISKKWIDLNLCYTSNFLSTDITNQLMQNYLSSFNTTANKNFLCLNVWSLEIKSLKHYEIYPIEAFNSKYQHKILSPFIHFWDTFMKLTRYRKDWKSFKTYINTYNSGLIYNENNSKIFKKLWVPYNSLYKDLRIGAVASNWNKNIEIYLILDE